MQCTMGDVPCNQSLVAVKGDVWLGGDQKYVKLRGGGGRCGRGLAQYSGLAPRPRGPWPTPAWPHLSVCAGIPRPH